MIRLLALASAAILFAAAPAHADPISTFVALLANGAGIAAAGAAAFGSIGFALIRFGIGTALSALGRALSGKRSGPKNPGIRTDVTTEGGTLPQTLILGTYATAGNAIAPWYATGRSGDVPNAFRYQMRDLCDLPITALKKIWVDDVEFDVAANLTGSLTSDAGATPDPTTRAKWVGNLWVRFQDGSQTAADPEMVTKFGSHAERPWTADMVGTGVAWLRTTHRYTTKVYTGEPQVLAEVDGIALYDRRADDTAGGDGDQRLATPSTWEFSRNPMLMIEAILRGIPLPDGEIYGLGVAEADMPFEIFAAAQDVCDAVVEGEVQYRAGFEVRMADAETGGDEPLDVIDELLKACSGLIADCGGTWVVRAGAPGLPVATITDDDLVIDRPEDMDPYKGMAETFNAIRASHPDPAQMWKPTEAPARYDSTAEASDGTRLVADVPLPAVPYAVQVQRLMDAWLKDVRRQRRHTITLPPEYSGLLPGDTLAWTSDYNGYTAKLFEIDEVVIDPWTLAATVALREVDPTDYDWDPEFELPVTTPSSEVIIFDPEALPGANVEAISITDGLGSARRPGLRLTWSTLLSGVAAIAWEVRLDATAEMVASGTTNSVADGETIVSEGLIPEEDYEVRMRGLDRDTDWCAWIDVTTLAAATVVAADLAGVVDAAAFAAGIKPVEILSSLPGPTHVAGRIVFLTTDAKLYRNTGAGWTAVVASTDISGQLLTAQFADGAVTAPKMAAGSVIASKMAVTDWENLYPGGSFADGDMVGIATGLGTSTIEDGTDVSGGKYLEFTRTSISTNGFVIAQAQRRAAVIGGAQYWCETSAKAETAPLSAGFYYGVVWYDASDTLISYSYVATNVALGTSYTAFSGQVTAPSNAAFARWIVRNHSTNSGENVLHIDRVVLRRANAGNLLVDGAILANHMSADSVTAGAIAAGAVGATAIETDSLVLSLFASGVLQVPLLPIDIEIFQEGDSVTGYSPSHDGLAQVYVIGAGASGAAGGKSGSSECSCSGGAAGAVARIFLPKIEDHGPFDITIGAPGNGVGPFSSPNVSNGNAGGDTQFESTSGIDILCEGGNPGLATSVSLGVTDGAVGGTFTFNTMATDLGAEGWNGGDSAGVNIGGNNKRATGGAAPDFGFGSNVDGAGLNLVGGGIVMDAIRLALSVPPIPFANMLGNGTDGVQSNGTGTFVSADAPPGAGSGGVASVSTSRSGPGGTGMIVIIYYGTGNLK